MLTQNLTCPYCSSEFSAAVWVDGKCDKCGGNYYWSMEFNKDLTDGWHVIEWDKKKSIYIASTLSNWERVRAFVRCFKRLDIPIAFDWTTYGEEIFSIRAPRDLDPISLRQKAFCEYNGVSSASYVFVIEPSGRGTNFEFGIAYQRFKATNNPIITILDETETTTPVSFHYLPGIKRTKHVKNAIIDILKHFDIYIKDTDIEMLVHDLENYDVGSE
jgi:hypothetical protein